MGLFSNRVKEEPKKKEEKKLAPKSEYHIYKTTDGNVSIEIGAMKFVATKRQWAFLDHLIQRLCSTGLISHEIFMRVILNTMDDHAMQLVSKGEEEECDDGEEE
ncbi:MAG: hypothetical protein ACYTBS_27625 [Planctomycetota bacterium]|jgi:hypothetical protein